ADNDQKRRFLRSRGRSTETGETAIPAGGQAGPQRRPARAQVAQDVADLVDFLREAENRRTQGRPAPTPKSMQEVLGAFRGRPDQQATIQVLAAAATTRHLAAHTTGAWEQLAHENAARLEALRAQQYRWQQQQYVQGQMPPDEIARRLAERQAADRDSDKRAFDAAAALALSYVAAKSVPSLDTLAALSAQHLAVAEPIVDVPVAVAESFARAAADHTAAADTAEMDFDKGADGSEASSGPDTRTDVAAAVEEGAEADVSDPLERVGEPAPTSSSDLGKIGAVLESAGRGLATAVGPVSGDDEVAPPLAPVDPTRLSQELLDAIGAAMRSHPRSVTEMLNIERRSDHTTEAVFVPDTGVEHSQEATLSY
ncbi:hypothetical protein, partial [Rhodococcus aetherivorans]